MTEPDDLDDIVRALADLIIEDGTALLPQLTPGYLLGLLDVGQATRFANLAHDLTTDRLAVTIDDDGTLRLHAVA